ncbi:hypothetical protein B296_00032768 [Ensete ventricosum]|uniref:Uncharacterized protein n=1 Tax=Ensete ventricosum TaxID=4639 RepID=A0A427ACM5_ENSVE|nr:hypothetical protein B296_00032768 [Ensete ventricosum]
MATGEIDEVGIRLVPLVGEMLRVNAALPEPEVAASVPKQGLQGAEAPFASAKGVVRRRVCSGEYNVQPFYVINPLLDDVADPRPLVRRRQCRNVNPNCSPRNVAKPNKTLELEVYDRRALRTGCEPPRPISLGPTRKVSLSLSRARSPSLCSPPPEKTLSSALESDKDPRRALLLRSDLVAHLVPSVILVPLGGGRNRTVLRSRDREEKLILAAPEAASYWIRYPIGKRMEDCFAAVFEIPNLANGRGTGGPTQEEHARPEIPCPGKLDSLLAADELYSYSWHKS